MQLGGVRSTSQAANSFMGTGFWPVVIPAPADKPAVPDMPPDPETPPPPPEPPPPPPLCRLSGPPPGPLPPVPLITANLSTNLDDLSTIFMLFLCWFPSKGIFCVLNCCLCTWGAHYFDANWGIYVVEQAHNFQIF